MTSRPTIRGRHLGVLVLAVLIMAGCATRGTTPDPQTELAALYLAADTGNPKAQLRLAQLYGRGHYGVTRDYALALHWLDQAADNGEEQAQSIYARWTAGEQARELVVAAVAAHKAGHRDHALPLLRRLAEDGVPEAAYMLGRIHLEEAADAGGQRRARRWLAAAAEAGDANARYLLGTLDAKDAQTGEAAAAHWQGCADQGHAMCQYSLGLLLMTGDGVAENPDRGRQLIRSAAAQGYDKAEQWLARWRRYCRQGGVAPACDRAP